MKIHSLYIVALLTGIFLLVGCSAKVSQDEIRSLRSQSIQSDLNREALVSRFRAKFEDACILWTLGVCTKKIGKVREDGFYFWTDRAGEVIIKFDDSFYIINERAIKFSDYEWGVLMRFDDKDDFLTAYSLLEAINTTYTAPNAGGTDQYDFTPDKN